jgi:hypothetical protein
VFENNDEHRIEPWNHDAILVWHRAVETVVAVASARSDGLLAGEITWGQGVGFRARDAKDLSRHVAELEKKY